MEKNNSKVKIRTASDVDFKELSSSIPELPRDIKDWINNVLFSEDNYFFTKTEKGIKRGICTHCLVASQIRPRPATANYPDLQRIGKKHNDISTCPYCGKKVQFKDNGRSRKNLVNYGYFYILQPMNNGGLVLRTFYCRRILSYTDLFADNAPEELDVDYSEHFRIFMHGDILACFKHLFIDWIGSYNDYWKSISKMIIPHCHYGNVYQSRDFTVGTYKPESWKEIIPATEYRYSCLDAFADKPDIAGKYIELYLKNPVLMERIIKQGFKSVIFEKLDLNRSTHGIINFNKETPAEAFKLDKASLKMLPENTRILDIARAAFIFANRCSVETLKAVQVLDCDDLKKLKTVCKKVRKAANVNKVFKYVRQQSKKEKSSFQAITADYYDYIQQIIQLSMPISESTIFPPDLSKAHIQATALLNVKKIEIEKQKIEELDRDFKPEYEKLCKKYFYENDNYIIRPAKGKYELFVEGIALKHCVYSNYSDRYISGQVLILLVREKKNPDIPFYTLELNPKNKKIIQCRTLHNNSYVSNENVSALMEEYLSFLSLTKKERIKKVNAA